MTTDPVSRLLAAIPSGAGIPGDLYAAGAVFDATVPMWRFEVHGAVGIAARLSRWFDTPGELTEVHHAPLPDGAVLRFTLECVTPAGPWITHQVHVLTLDGERIARHEAWCGGRWDAALQAEMEVSLERARELV